MSCNKSTMRDNEDGTYSKLVYVTNGKNENTITLVINITQRITFFGALMGKIFPASVKPVMLSVLIEGN